MLSILVVTSMYPPHHYGGYELSCQDVVERWRRKGHRVRVLASDVRLPEVPMDAGEDGVDRSLRLYWRDHQLLEPRLGERLSIERHNQQALGRALTASVPDVVSVWQMGAMSMGLLTTVAEAGYPMVCVISDNWLGYAPSVDPWHRLFRSRLVPARLARRLTGVPTRLPDLDQCASFCFASQALMDWTRDAGRFRVPTAAVVPLGIDHVDFPPEARPANPWGWRLLYVGRIDERKGIRTAVTALAHLPESATLEILGSGDSDEMAALRALVAGLGLSERVQFGSVPRSALAARYRAADVLLFPVVWDEPFGLVPLEAMACSTPVVATGTGGSGEFLVDGENCLLFPPGDAAALAAAVRRLADDAPLRRRLTAAGLKTAARLGADRYADGLEARHVAAVEAAGLTAPVKR